MTEQDKITIFDALIKPFLCSDASIIAHLFLDATYTKVRRHDIVSDCAVFVAVGIEAETGHLQG